MLQAVADLINNETRRAFVPIAGLHHARREAAAGFCVFNDCGDPYDLGMVMEGGGAMSEVRTITTPGVADWYQVSFTATGRPGGGTPTVTFAANDDGAYVFDAYTQPPCGAPPATCGQGGENGAASKITEYTFVDDQPDCCAPPDDSMVPWPGVLYLRVYRVDAGQTCATYQLALSR